MALQQLGKYPSFNGEDFADSFSKESIHTLPSDYFAFPLSRTA